MRVAQTQEVKHVVIVGHKHFLVFILALMSLVLMSYLADRAIRTAETHKVFCLKNSDGLTMEDYLLQRHGTIIISSGGDQNKLRTKFPDVAYIRTATSEKDYWLSLFPEDGVAFIGDSLVSVFTNNLTSVGAKLGTKIDCD